MLRFRCHTGHAFTAEALLSAHGDEIERMLWGLLRSHRERAALVHNLAEQERKHHRNKTAAQLQQRALEYEADAELVQRLLAGRSAAPRDHGQA
jgi:two-component system chemotaxis response regulator CheB